ncbi:MAG: hypothetical protein RSB59_07010 [Clostridia bacterium]
MKYLLKVLNSGNKTNPQFDIILENDSKRAAKLVVKNYWGRNCKVIACKELKNDG